MSVPPRGIESLVLKLALYKHDYNVHQLQRIKTRAAQIIGFLLIITSIVFSGAITFVFETLFTNIHFSVLFVVGIELLLYSMIWCFIVMIRGDMDAIIDPEILSDLYENDTLEDTTRIVDATMFDILRSMDSRNDERHGEMFRIYILSVAGLVTTFIPLIWAITLNINV